MSLLPLQVHPPGHTLLFPLQEDPDEELLCFWVRATLFPFSSSSAIACEEADTALLGDPRTAKEAPCFRAPAAPLGSSREEDPVERRQVFCFSLVLPRKMETQAPPPPPPPPLPRLAKRTPSRFRRVCVFCGSSPGKKPSYQLAAIQLGKELVERSIDLVYGGGSVGLMGLVSQAVYDGGRHVLGVIPKTLMFREITGETIGEVRPVSGMHQRKAEMARQADAFIALPGGYGTLEELLEVITWAQLGIHEKPVGLLNVDGYYNSLLCFIDKAVDEGFITPTARHIIVSATSAQELMSKLEEYEPRHDGSAPKLSWEMEQLGQSPKSDIAR